MLQRLVGRPLIWADLSFIFFMFQLTRSLPGRVAKFKGRSYENPPVQRQHLTLVLPFLASVAPSLSEFRPMTKDQLRHLNIWAASTRTAVSKL